MTGKNDEKIGLTLTSYDDGTFNDINGVYLEYEAEKAYYKKIKRSVIKKIDDEFLGLNEYSRVETLDSRRFIYTSDTCISLAHFLFRDEMLDCKFFIRSSNTRDTLKYDLNFIKYLCKSVRDRLGLNEDIVTKIEVIINSAHVPSSIKHY